MNTALKLRWLRCFYLKLDHGFTLIEMLVVLIISSILAAIALPTFLSQANKAKQVEAKVSIATLNRAQQGYYLEHAEFADDIAKLGIALNERSEQYEYEIDLMRASRGSPASSAVQYANSRSDNLKAYVGMAGLTKPEGGESVIETIVCEAEQAGSGPVSAPPINNATLIDCGPGSQPLK